MNREQAADLSGQVARMNLVDGSGVGVGGSDGMPQHQPMQDMVDLEGIDAQFVMLRNCMRERIFEYIGRKQSSAEWRRRLPELVKRLEDILFRKFSNKDDYYNMMKGPIEPQLMYAIRTLSAQNQQTSRQIESSSGYGTMMSTPGSMSNGYQHMTTSIQQNSITNNGQSTMGPGGVPRMIPTPGANLDYSNGAGYFNGESAVAPHAASEAISEQPK